MKNANKHRKSIIEPFMGLLSGVLVGLAYPPAGLSWLVWVGLVPLLWGVSRSRGPRQAFLYGLLGGIAFGLITIKPLVSATMWGGWQTFAGADEVASFKSRQWWFLNGLWVVTSCWLGIFWGAFAALLRWLGPARPLRMLVVGPTLWVLLVEWLLSKTLFGFQWTFLGTVTADLAYVRQLAAMGGIWLLSALVIIVNVGIFTLLLRPRPRRYWLAPLIAGITVIAVLFLGAPRSQAMASASAGLGAAALQYHQERYTRRDFLRFGLDRSYLALIQKTLDKLDGRLDLLVLPESIAVGAVSLDGSRSASQAGKYLTGLKDWEGVIRSLLKGRDTVLVLGIDTVENASAYNSLLVWTREGFAGSYHKQRLVPFAEYQPVLVAGLGVRGASQYAAGKGSRIIKVANMSLGGFICQEVLFPQIIRQSVRNGAQILVSGGNDGVFADPAVAEIHALVARIRAVEAGRYIVRAMKTGISAIIDPTGRELRRSPSSKPKLLWARVKPLEHETFYVRFGDWALFVAGFAVVAVVVVRLRE